MSTSFLFRNFTTSMGMFSVARSLGKVVCKPFPLSGFQQDTLGRRPNSPSSAVDSSSVCSRRSSRWEATQMNSKAFLVPFMMCFQARTLGLTVILLLQSFLLYTISWIMVFLHSAFFRVSRMLPYMARPNSFLSFPPISCSRVYGSVGVLVLFSMF